MLVHWVHASSSQGMAEHSHQHPVLFAGALSHRAAAAWVPGGCELIGMSSEQMDGETRRPSSPRSLLLLQMHLHGCRLNCIHLQPLSGYVCGGVLGSVGA